MIMLRDYRLYTFVYTAGIPEYESIPGTGETQRTGKFIAEQREMRIVARSHNLANALWDDHWIHSACKHVTIIHVNVDAIDIINLSHTS